MRKERAKMKRDEDENEEHEKDEVGAMGGCVGGEGESDEEEVTVEEKNRKEDFVLAGAHKPRMKRMDCNLFGGNTETVADRSTKRQTDSSRQTDTGRCVAGSASRRPQLLRLSRASAAAAAVI